MKEKRYERYGRTFNWQTAIFGKVKNYKDEDDHPIHFETEFPAIVFDNTLTAIQSKPTVYLENEFPAIVYNDGLTSKSDFGIRPLINSECIDEINLIDETSLSEYDEEIVSRFNDLFNDIHPDDLKSEKDDDDNDIGIIQSSEDNEITHGENGFSETSHDKIIKTFETGSFVINLNIMIWNYYVNGMLFFLIINLYVSHGIPFDITFFMDGSHSIIIAVATVRSLSKTLIFGSPFGDYRYIYTPYQFIVDTPISDISQFSRVERGIGSEVEDGIFWRGTTGICESCLEVVVWDPRALSSRVYSGVPEYLLKMDNPNITMEEYIRLQEEKALSRGETFNWQTTTYGKMKYCEDEDDCFTNFKSEFPAIVLDNTITPREALSWEPTVSPLNDDEIDFRISFDESDDEDYTDLAKTMIWKLHNAMEKYVALENDGEAPRIHSMNEHFMSEVGKVSELLRRDKIKVMKLMLKKVDVEHDLEFSINKIFNSIDRNNDSSISPTELKDYIIHQYDLDIHDIADDLVDIRMELLDADANGSIKND
ncbi:reverse transcriptase domain-containing protein [Tanacetum coccineum]|uniref:Reverse transcriptase domain-containing protein n=1 Tax=Tanacetum coccineum TaxID=301880 RepID=A0ABQ5FCK8_9ASTR